MTAQLGVRLTPLRRARVVIRRCLYAGLRVVPGPVVDVVHDRWIASKGLGRLLWRPLAAVLFYRPIPHRTVVVPGGHGARLHVVGSRLERILWWYGEDGYERHEAAAWRRLCSQASDVLEIGANVGYYSVLGASATNGRYTAVEPNPEAVAVVRRNLELNNLTSVTVMEAAAVGSSGTDEVELAVPDQEAHSTAPTGAFLREGTESVADRAASRSIRVAAISAASLFAGRDLVKLDIEGSEAEVLDAARDQIRRTRPVILVEVLAESTHLRRVIAELLKEGYLLCETNGQPHSSPPSALGNSTSRDVLLVPSERENVGQ